MKGWIKLHRQIQSHWMWEETRVFSKLEAWIDILLSANHKDAEVIIKFKVYNVKRGESLRSLETWANRWSWNKSKVRRFLKLLEEQKMIVLKNETQTTRITICKYDSYQDQQNEDETQVKRKRNASETEVTPDKNDNNDKNEKKVYMGGKSFTESEILDKYNKYLELYTKVTGNQTRPRKNFKQVDKNFIYWLDIYTPSDIHKAMQNYDENFWAKNITPQWLLRQKDQKKEAVDYIGSLLNYKPKSKIL